LAGHGFDGERPFDGSLVRLEGHAALVADGGVVGEVGNLLADLVGARSQISEVLIDLGVAAVASASRFETDLWVTRTSSQPGN
jgi:hypothetical protein